MNTWNHTANSIFLDAIDIQDPIQRELFLETACDGRTDIKTEVLELLNAHDESNGFLEDSKANESTCALDFASNEGQNGHQATATSKSCLQKGAMLGRYRIDRELGNGAMGVVYLATDTRLNRLVAIKIPRTEMLRDAEQRIEREARTMASVKHRNLASILDVDQCDGVTFLVMEFVAGSNLSDQLRDGKRMSGLEAARIMLKLAEATTCAHSSGIVHRDIKPANIIIDENNEPILMDFGLAYRDSEDARMTKFGAILGTPAYMAPEQVLGAAHLVGPHSDIYALGAILYELVTGSTIYPGRASEVLDSLANCKPVTLPSRVQPNIDKWLEAICMKAIANQPAQRFQSSRDLADAFRYYLSDDQAKLQLLLGPEQPMQKPTHMNGWIAAGILVALAAGGIYYALQPNEKNPTTPTNSVASAKKSNELARANWSKPERVRFVSGNVPATNASISGDGLRIVFMLRTEQEQVLCESIRGDRNEPFSEPRSIDNLVLDSDQKPLNERFGNPWLSMDGLDMILYCLRPEIGTDLYHTHRDSLDSPWLPLRPLGKSINSQGHEYAASMPPDKLSVYWFRPHPSNPYDGEIWTATRASPIEDFGPARLLGSGINTTASEQHPCISEHGLLLTFDRGTPDPRLWQSARNHTTEEFSDAYPLAFQGLLKDQNAYCPSMTADSKLLIFTSNAVKGREGFETGELWQCLRVP
jgi:serine/threonine protein kinase